MRRLLSPLALALSMTTACNADRGVGPEAGILIEASISDASIGSAETATITYRLRNVSRTTRTVSVDCDIATLLVHDERGENVFPGSRSITCISVYYPPDVLTPGEELTRTFVVGGSTGSSFVKLPPGRYTAEAEFGIGLSKRRYSRLRAAGPAFEVTP